MGILTFWNGEKQKGINLIVETVLFLDKKYVSCRIWFTKIVMQAFIVIHLAWNIVKKTQKISENSVNSILQQKLFHRDNSVRLKNIALWSNNIKLPTTKNTYNFNASHKQSGIVILYTLSFFVQLDIIQLFTKFEQLYFDYWPARPVKFGVNVHVNVRKSIRKCKNDFLVLYI